MTAKELTARFSMDPHAENGTFLERHYEHSGPERAASGSIFYYVAPGERTKFHSIDCDEYWIYNEGAPLELWQIAPDGALSVRLLGTEEGCEPFIHVPKGNIFASRHRDEKPEDGTFITCVTVPRFTYEGFTLFEDGDVQKQYPQLKPFFE